jgi:hypothetical protein
VHATKGRGWLLYQWQRSPITVSLYDRISRMSGWETQSVVSENVTSALNQVCGTLLFTRSGHRPLSPSIQNGRTRTQLICRLLTDLFGYDVWCMTSISVIRAAHSHTHPHTRILAYAHSDARVRVLTWHLGKHAHTQPHVCAHTHTWTVCRSMKTHPHPIITTTPTFRSLSTSPMYPPAPVLHRVRTPCILSIYHH